MDLRKTYNRQLPEYGNATFGPGAPDKLTRIRPGTRKQASMLEAQQLAYDRLKNIYNNLKNNETTKQAMLICQKRYAKKIDLPAQENDCP